MNVWERKVFAQFLFVLAFAQFAALDKRRTSRRFVADDRARAINASRRRGARMRLWSRFGICALIALVCLVWLAYKAKRRLNAIGGVGGDVDESAEAGERALCKKFHFTAALKVVATLEIFRLNSICRGGDSPHRCERRRRASARRLAARVGAVNTQRSRLRVDGQRRHRARRLVAERRALNYRNLLSEFHFSSFAQILCLYFSRFLILFCFNILKRNFHVYRHHNCRRLARFERL